MHFRPSRSSLVLAAAIVATGVWLVGTLVGAHPDGSLLGFGGTLFSIYALTEQQWRSQGSKSKAEIPPPSETPPTSEEPPAEISPESVVTSESST